jgi:hypothetical protein
MHFLFRMIRNSKMHYCFKLCFGLGHVNAVTTDTEDLSDALMNLIEN